MHNIISFFQYIAQSNLINFLLMLYILYWIISKLDLNSYLEKSIENVEQTIKDSEYTKNNSQKQLRNIKTEMRKLPEELNKIENDTEEKAQNLKKQIDLSTQKTLDNIKANVSKVMGIEEKKIRSDIVSKTVKKTVLTAQANIENLLKEKPELHYQFIEESLSELDKVKI